MATSAVLMIVMASLMIVMGVKKVVMVKVIKKVSSNKFSPLASSDKSHRQDVHHCIARSALEAASPRDKPLRVGYKIRFWTQNIKNMACSIFLI